MPGIARFRQYNYPNDSLWISRISKTHRKLNKTLKQCIETESALDALLFICMKKISITFARGILLGEELFYIDNHKVY